MEYWRTRVPTIEIIEYLEGEYIIATQEGRLSMYYAPKTVHVKSIMGDHVPVKLETCNNIN